MAILPVTRRSQAGQSPPAKRLQGVPASPSEVALKDTLEDHATRLDQHHKFLKQIVEMSVETNKKIDEKDRELPTGPSSS
jgi:hypothetical protein